MKKWVKNDVLGQAWSGVTAKINKRKRKWSRSGSSCFIEGQNVGLFYPIVVKISPAFLDCILCI